MKKSVFLFFSILLFLFVSCENFMNGSDVQDQLAKMIDVANAKSFTIVISNDTTMGSFLSSGDKECKVGYSIDVQFGVKKDTYIYKGLKAVSKSDETKSMDSYVEFTQTDSDEPRGVYKTSIKLLKESDDILIVPDCILVPNVIKEECKPEYNEGGREQDSTITIVFNTSVTTTEYFVPSITDAYGQSLAQYFEEAYFSADQTTLFIPTNKTKHLIEKDDTTATKDIFVKLDLTQIQDADGNTGKTSYQHKYRVNKNLDSNKPVITDAKLFSTKDTESKYYKEIPEKNFDNSWTAEDFSLHHTSTKVYVEFSGTDVGSGISGAYVKETLIKYSDGSAANESASYHIPASWDESSQVWAAEYTISTGFDGIIQLDFSAEDYAGNVSDSKKTFYVLKDIVVDTSVIKFDSEYSSLLTSTDPFALRGTSGKNIIKAVEEMNKAVDENDIQTVTLKLSDNAKDSYYPECSAKYDVEVYWGYSEDSINQKAIENTDKTLSFKRDVNKLVYLNVVCTDEVGNTRTINKQMAPRLELETAREENEFITTSVIAKDADSLAALCKTDINGANGPVYIVYYIFKYDTTYNNKSNSITSIRQSPGVAEQIAIESSDPSTTPVFLREALREMTIPEDIYGISQTGKIQAYAIPAFGDFPAPYSISSIQYTISKLINAEDDTNGVIAEDYLGQFQKTSDSNMSYIYIHGTGPAFTGGETENQTPPQIVSEYGPINDKAKVTFTPILNSGYCRFAIEDYINPEWTKNNNIVYLFSLLNFYYEETTQSYIMAKAEHNTKKTPEFFVPAFPGNFAIHIEAYDKTENKKYVPKALPQMNQEYSKADLQALCVAGLIFDVDEDVTPPTIDTGHSQGLDQMFNSSGAYRINAIYEENLEVKDGKATITYYLIPNTNTASPATGTYTLEELENTYSAFAKTVEYRATIYNGNNVIQGDPYIDIPYGNTKEGFYTLAIVVKDSYGNSTVKNVPVLNTVKGELLKNIKYQWNREIFYATPDDTTNSPYNFYWQLNFNSKEHDEIKTWETEDGQTAFSIKANIECLDFNFWDNTYSWNTGFNNSILNNYETRTENGKTYYEFTYDYNNTPTQGAPWARIRAWYGFDNPDNQSVLDKGSYYNEYVYIGNSNTTCHSKNCIEGLNGIQVISDRPVFAHTMYCPDKLTASKYDNNAIRIWESKGVETGIAVLNGSINERESPYYNAGETETSGSEVGSETYDNDRLSMVPAGAYYTTIFHFADGTTIMSDIKQKQ